MIGIDFDNTIVCYDRVFGDIAVEHGLAATPRTSSKTALRDHLRALGQEPRWTELQGIVYGPRIGDAIPFPGVLEFFSRCRMEGRPVAVISHRSRHPYAGERYDLHEAARSWLERQGFHDPDRTALQPQDVYLEESLDAKLVRIATAGCSHFIDDLPEVLGHPRFPVGVQRILFDPHGTHTAPPESRVARSWPEIAALLAGDTRP